MSTTTSTTPFPSNATSDHATISEPTSSHIDVIMTVVNSVAVVSYIVSAFLSLVLIVAIALPLILEPKKFNASASFNLYLVVLLVADLVGIVCCISICVRFYGWEGTEDWLTVSKRLLELQHRDGTAAIIGIYLSIPVVIWMTAFISHEILKLLRNSRQRKRCKPPGIRKVALQAMVAFAIGIVSLGLFCLLKLKFRVTRWPFHVVRAIMPLPPVLYSLWVVHCVVKEGLMKVGANVGNRLRVLVVYFYRIILVYIVVLFTLEISTFTLLAIEWKYYGLHTWFYFLVWSFQGWVSFAIIVTKPDVGKMVRDLLACRLCCPRRQPENSNGTIGISKTTNSKGPKTGEEGMPHQIIKNERETERTECKDLHRIEQERKEQLQKRISKEFISGVTNYLSGDDEDEEDSL